VRRHPDIKWLRRESDVEEFARAQGRLLDASWRVLAPGGKLLYATCSVFPEENGDQVRGFLSRQPGAGLLPLPRLSGWEDSARGQILPSASSDGFYYALLMKPVGDG
jgi:16S rRNA (cytosine967-C5)-methyltransferase